MMDNVLNYNDFIKSANQNKILSHPDIQQRMLMLMGENKDQKLELTKDEENKIAQNYQKMYFALATIRWCNGEKLGIARQHALEQMNSYVKTKTNIAHPMNKYLVAINSQINREVSYHNMTDKHSDKTINMNSELAKKWSTESAKIFQQCMKNMNEMYKKYMPEKNNKQTPATVKFQLAQHRTQQMLQQIILEQQRRQRAA
ncbi:MAG: hypothetical protein ACLRFP_02850 [Alphaproteobacteria bacterium]